MEDQVLFNEEGVMITTNEIIRGKETYSVASIISVGTSTQEPPDGCIAIIGAVVCFFVAIVVGLVFGKPWRPVDVGGIIAVAMIGVSICILIIGIWMKVLDMIVPKGNTYAVHQHLN